MSQRLDQLLYMWSRLGLEGPSRFQIRAASAGFLPVNSSLTVAARELCTYQPPDGAEESPVSFGWVNHGTRRFVFVRRAVGIDSWGRHGGFVAHVLGGPLSALPTDLTSTWYGAPFWMASDDDLGERTDLPVLSVEQLTSAPLEDVDAELQRRFLAAVLSTFSRGQPLAVVADYDTVARTMAAVAATVPTEMLAAVTFSSYEPASTAHRYDIVGVHEPADAPPAHTVLCLDDRTPIPPGPALDLADAFLECTATADVQIAAALESAAGSRRFSFRRFAQVYVTLRALATGRPPDTRTCTVLVSHPESARLLIRDGNGRSGLGIALASADSETWTAFEKVAATLSGSERDLVAAAIAEAIVARAATVRVASAEPLKRTEAVSAGMAETLYDVLITAIDSDAGLVERLDEPTAVALLRHAARTGSATEEALEALLDGVAPHALSHADADALPTTWRAELVQRGWQQGIRMSHIARLLASDGEGLTTPLAERLSIAGELTAFAEDLVRSTDPETAATVLTRLQHRAASTADLIVLLRHALRLSAPVQQLQLMDQWGVSFGRRRIDGDDADWLGRAVSAGAAAQIGSDALRPTRQALEVSRGLSRLLKATAHASSESAVWSDIIAASPAVTFDHSSEVGALVANLPQPQRFAAAVLAYDRAILHARNAHDLDSLFRTLFAAVELPASTPKALILSGYRPRFGAPPQLLVWSFSFVLFLVETDKTIHRFTRTEAFHRFWISVGNSLSEKDRELFANRARRITSPARGLARSLARR